MRDLKITLTPSSGTINWFYVKVGSFKVIDADGSSARSWSGDAGATQTTIVVKARGFGNAKYKVSLDLTGTLQDQELEVQLIEGRHELQLFA